MLLKGSPVDGKYPERVQLQVALIGKSDENVSLRELLALDLVCG